MDWILDSRCMSFLILDCKLSLWKDSRGITRARGNMPCCNSDKPSYTRMHVYIVYTCMCTCLSVNRNEYLLMCVHAHIHIHTYVYVHIHACIDLLLADLFIERHLFMCLIIFASIFIVDHTYIHKYIRTYIHTCTTYNTYINTYMNLYIDIHVYTHLRIYHSLKQTCTIFM